MINGAHVIIYSKDAEADRAFFRDVLRFPAVDAGGGSTTEAAKIVLLVLFSSWALCAVVSTALTVRWFRKFHRTEASSSLVWTSLAGFPGVALLVELGVHGIQQVITGWSPKVWDFPGTVLSVLWLFVGPVLLLVGFVSRYMKRDVPRGTTLVQVSHGVMWTWSTMMGMWFAANA